MDIMTWIQSLLSPGMPPAGPPVTPGSAPTLGGAPATPGTGILGGAPQQDSIFGNALRGLAGSFSAGGGGGGIMGQIGRGLSGGVQAVDQHKQQKLRDYYLNRQFAQQDAADKQKQKQAEMLAKIPAPNGMNPQDWANLPDETKLALYTQSLTPEKPKHSAAYTEYQDAQAGGYTGSSNDYQTMDANRRAPRVTNVSNSPGPETWGAPTKDQSGMMVQTSNRGQIRQLQGPNTGGTETERALYTLQHADAGSSEYAAAASILTQPRLISNPDGTFQVSQPKLPAWAKPPTYAGQPTTPAAEPVINLDNSEAPAAAGFDATPVAPAAAAPQQPVTIPGQGGFGTPGATGGVPMSQAAPPPSATPVSADVPGFTVSKPVQGGGPKQNKTEAQSIAAGYAMRTQTADKQINDIVSGGYTPTVKDIWMATNGGMLGAYALSPQAKQFDQAKRNFINAVLRRESGAAIAPSEFDSGNKQYFPMPDDDPGTLAQKALNRQQAIQSLQMGAGTYLAQPAAAPADAGRSVSGGNVAGGIVGGGTAPTQIQDDAGFNALPSGAHFVGPDGIERVKP